MRTEEKIHQLQKQLKDCKDPAQAEVLRAAIAELNRRDAVQAIGGQAIVASQKQTDWKSELLKTDTGKQMVQAKITAEGAADRIRQLKQLVHDVFVVMPRYAEPINGWVPRVRFDIYQKAKDTCRKLGQAGGPGYDKVVTTVKYALENSKA
jgi:hypothetical protein